MGGPPPLRRMVLPAIFVAALFLVVFMRQPQQPAGLQEWVVSGPTMGTTFTVKVVVDDLDEAGRRQLAAKVREVVDGRAYVSGSCGPCGRTLLPYGDAEPDDVRESFRRQIKGLGIVTAVAQVYMQNFCPRPPVRQIDKKYLVETPFAHQLRR